MLTCEVTNYGGSDIPVQVARSDTVVAIAWSRGGGGDINGGGQVTMS